MGMMNIFRRMDYFLWYLHGNFQVHMHLHTKKSFQQKQTIYIRIPSKSTTYFHTKSFKSATCWHFSFPRNFYIIRLKAKYQISCCDKKKVLWKNSSTSEVIPSHSKWHLKNFSVSTWPNLQTPPKLRNFMC